MNKYTITTKDFTYSAVAETKENAIDRLYNNLKNYKWSREKVASEIMEATV